MLAWWLAAVLACSGPEVGPREGRRAPEIDAQTLAGEAFELSDLRGRPVVLVFWASWCGPCRQEAPEIAELSKHYGERVHIVSVNASEDPAVAKRAAQQWGITWPVVTDPLGATARAYEVSAIPLVLILDGDGLVRYRGNGLPSDTHRILDGLSG